MYSTSPLVTSKRKYMAHHQTSNCNSNASSSPSPFLSFCAVCETQLDGFTPSLYCSDECRQHDCFKNPELPSFPLLSDAAQQKSMDENMPPTFEPARPPSPAATDSTRNSVTSFDLSNRASNASLYSSSMISRRKMSDAFYSTTTCSPVHSPVATTAEEFELLPEPPLLHSTTAHSSTSSLTNTATNGQTNTNGHGSVTATSTSTANHRISAPIMTTATSSPMLGPHQPKPRRQSFYVRSGSQLFSRDSIEIPSSGSNKNKNRTSVSSASNILSSESPRSISLVMPNTPVDQPPPELEYEFPKIEKRDSASSGKLKKLFY